MAGKFTEWVEFLESQGKSQNTVEAYLRALQHFDNWHMDQYGDELDPERVIPRDVRDWKEDQQDEGDSPATINPRLSAVKQYFQWLQLTGNINSNPAEPIHSLTTQQYSPRGLTIQDERALIRAVDRRAHTDWEHWGKRDRAIIILMLETGIRVGELLDLNVGDVVIRERSGYLTIRSGKGGSYREIPLTKDARDALESWLVKRYGSMERDPDDPLWIGQRGPLRTRSAIYRLLNKYAYHARLDVDDISPHTLRHTFAHRYLEANPDDIRGLSELLGHKSIETTMIYTQPSREDLAERLENKNNRP